MIKFSDERLAQLDRLSEPPPYNDGLASYCKIDREFLAAICTLAKRGLATMPRPIAEAPRDGTDILVYYPSRLGAEKWSVRSWQRGDWGSVTEGWADCFMQIKTEQPTHFIPLSALESE